MNLTRNCPTCNKEILYTNKNNCLNAEKRGSECRSCQAKKKVGPKNPFYGKQHTQQTKDKISYFNSEIRILSLEFIQKAKENLSKVTNSTPLYDIWFEKYGKEIANKKLQELKIKQSESNKGSKNPMFGKSSPQGSGNGWSGWYNNWYFRSLRELSYMINVIEKENLTWESPNFKIKYKDHNEIERNYFPDFFISKNKIVEIKPQKLHNTPKVLAKQAAAKLFCQENGFEYEIIDPPILSNDEIKQLYLGGKIKFLDRYDSKFKERFLI